MNKIGRNDPCPCGSGKKFKQCCAEREAGTPASAAPAASALHISQALNAALQYHQLGRFPEAERLYRQVLDIAPANPDALHLLGVAAHQTGRHAEAVELIGKAIALFPSEPLMHNNLGDAYRALGRPAEALASFQKALLLKPDFHEVHNNLGETYRIMGCLEQAIASFQQVLALQPGYAEAHHNLGLALHAQGRFEEAMASFDKAIAIKPQYAKAWLNLGLTCQAGGQQSRALSCFDKALALRPDYPEALQALTRLLAERGEMIKAVRCCQRLLQIQPDADAGWSLYADILKLLSTEALASVEPSMLLQAFGNQAVDPQKLERIATASVCQHPLVRLLLPLDNGMPDSTPHIDHAYADGILLPLLQSPLLLALLEQALITDYRLERLLARLRHLLLLSAVQEDQQLLQPAVERFCCCLALQCFANEYIYAVSPEEEQALATLTGRIAQTLEEQKHVPLAWLAGAACYQALHRLPFAEKLSPSAWPQADARALLQRQLQQPQQEEKIRQAIPGLTGITDAISQAVREQYEENPYPRWKRRGGTGPGQPVHVALQHRLPHQALPGHSPPVPQILVAGCGTGSDAFQVAQAFGNAQILAVDISKTSLAYAIRATGELGINNIDFRHADILALGSLGRQFDLIVCSGVLHHMRDPIEGWRVLTDLLRPDGYMNIGLYSKRARRGITALRQLVQEQAYPSTPEGIRRFRTDVMAADSGIDLGTVAGSPDFYSTSACRDLIFHVQEHQFTPLDIAAHLDQLGLQFLGFELPNPDIRQRYLARFPENPACDWLAAWDQVEQDNPDIFAGMYQFWVKKRGLD